MLQEIGVRGHKEDKARREVRAVVVILLELNDLSCDRRNKRETLRSLV
jgi:hypothetical protein